MLSFHAMPSALAACCSEIVLLLDAEPTEASLAQHVGFLIWGKGVAAASGVSGGDE